MIRAQKEYPLVSVGIRGSFRFLTRPIPPRKKSRGFPQIPTDIFDGVASLGRIHEPDPALISQHYDPGQPLKADRAGRHSIRINPQCVSAPYRRGEVPIVSKSSTIIEEIPNPTPGEILLLEFIQPMGLTQNGLARAIGVPPRRINEIGLGKRAVTTDTDPRLGRFFILSEGFWLGLQSDHDLMRQRRKIVKELECITPRADAA
jgi:antitoxin HigA-1